MLNLRGWESKFLSFLDIFKHREVEIHCTNHITKIHGKTHGDPRSTLDTWVDLNYFNHSNNFVQPRTICYWSNQQCLQGLTKTATREVRLGIFHYCLNVLLSLQTNLDLIPQMVSLQTTTQRTNNQTSAYMEYMQEVGLSQMTKF